MSRANYSWLLFFAAIVPGCAFMDPFEAKQSALPPPPVKEVHAFCYEEIHVVSDSANHERPLPGLVGKVYLASGGLKSVMVEADGAIQAELYDATPGAEPLLLAKWTFDKNALKLSKQSDIVGLGYTLFLPWETYKPSVKRVQVRMWYEEPGKQPRFADPQLITFKTKQPAPMIVQTNYTDVPSERDRAAALVNAP